MTIREKLQAEKHLVFDNEYETQGYRNAIEVAESTCYTLLNRDEGQQANDISYVYLTECYVGYCPNCENSVSNMDNFCSKCGQRLDWSKYKKYTNMEYQQ